MLACLSPNGRATYALDEPLTTLLVGTVRGIVSLRPSADRRPWQAVPMGLDGIQINALATEPKSGTVLVGTAGRGLYASTDRGVTWERRGDGLPDQHVFAMALDDRSESPVFYAGMLPPALYRSRDLGLNWEQLPSLGDVADAERWEFRAPPGAAHVKNIAFHPTKPETLYVCIEQGG
ncbi:MAG TPA: glycosyl hydrolase, partial [Chloroflexota bacterium]